MSWEHTIAKELRNRDNRDDPAWFTGRVLSPVRHEDEEGHVTYSGPLIISAYDGAVMLRSGQLVQLARTAQAPGIDRLYEGLSVALLGDIFSGEPGSLQVLVLGVVQDAV